MDDLNQGLYDTIVYLLSALSNMLHTAHELVEWTKLLILIRILYYLVMLTKSSDTESWNEIPSSEYGEEKWLISE